VFGLVKQLIGNDSDRNHDNSCAISTLLTDLLGRAWEKRNNCGPDSSKSGRENICRVVESAAQGRDVSETRSEGAYPK